LIINHMRGTPDTWAKLPPMKDVIGGIGGELDASIHRARRSGMELERIVIDPGIGFGKRKEQNAEILAKLSRFARLDCPLLVGPSRKHFLAQDSAEKTEFATAAAVAAAILGGAHIVRVHDVTAMRSAAQIADAIVEAQQETEQPSEPQRPFRARPEQRDQSETASPERRRRIIIPRPPGRR
jgi:dihydropteroate synthase